MLTKRHTIRDGFFIALFACCLAWAFNFRAGVINHVYGRGISCNDCLSYPVFAHDLWFLSALLALAALSFCVRHALLYIPLRLAALAGLGFYILDVLVFSDFSTRLHISDLRIYGDKWSLIWRHIQSTELLSWQLWPVAVAGLLLLGLLVAPSAGMAHPRLKAGLLAIPVVGLIAGTAMEPPSYIHEWALRNIVASHLTAGVAEPYSRAYKQRLLDDSGDETLTCRVGENHRPDIVLLILESWSHYQSDLFSGIHDWTPRLDKLARQHTWYPRLYSGGFSTNKGLISLLAGLDYIAPQKSPFGLYPFETAWETPQTLPHTLRENGDYLPVFLTSGNLSFSRKGDWLKHIGFTSVEGHDYSGYDGMPRLHFDSVPDSALYDRSLDVIEQLQKKERPLFLTIETVSTHHPYIQPDTRERSQELAFRYMDKTAHDFYTRLKEKNFFDNGLLLIISDHRAMVPISREETRRFGRAAASLVPAIAIGEGAPGGGIETPYHQSDLLDSLAALTTEQYCYAGPYRSLFDPGNTEPRCLYHSRGDNRDLVDAFCPDGEFVVKMQGDKTRVIEAPAASDASRRQEIVQAVNLHRIKGNERSNRLRNNGFFAKHSQ